jgi:hypothetical protein
MSGSMVEIANERSSQEQSECGQERRTTETQSILKYQEILEKELEILKRELELMKARFRNNSTRNIQQTPDTQTNTETEWVQNKVNLNIIAELLPEFNDRMGDFRMWRNKLKILEQNYKLNDNQIRILIGTRLRGKALAWLHSADEHVV